VATPVHYNNQINGNNVLDYTTAVIAADDETAWFTHQVPIQKHPPPGAHPTVDITAGYPSDFAYQFVLAAVKP